MVSEQMADWNRRVEDLASAYHGVMPFDQSHSDEEHEDTVALRKARKRAAEDLAWAKPKDES